jgi:hypothetical protein
MYLYVFSYAYFRTRSLTAYNGSLNFIFANFLCMHVCIYVCMYVCMYVSMYV